MRLEFKVRNGIKISLIRRLRMPMSIKYKNKKGTYKVHQILYFEIV